MVGRLASECVLTYELVVFGYGGVGVMRRLGEFDESLGQLEVWLASVC